MLYDMLWYYIILDWIKLYYIILYYITSYYKKWYIIVCNKNRNVQYSIWGHSISYDNIIIELQSDLKR